MAVRLYQKGRQTYAKETLLFKAAKHSARAAAKAQATAELQQQQQVLSSHSITSSSGYSGSGSVAIRAIGNTAAAGAAAARSFPGSFKAGNALARSFNASFSRLQSPMIVVADQTAAAAAAGGSPRRQAAAATTRLGLSSTASRAAWLGSGRQSLEQQRQPLLSGTSSDQAAPAAAGSGGMLDGVTDWLPGMLQSDEHSHLAGLRKVSGLCQVRPKPGTAASSCCVGSDGC
jgi:hypothetical protein